nr:transposase [Luteimonas aquatica]
MKKRFTDEQIITILREAETGALSIKGVCRKHNITDQTFFCWCNKFGGLEVPDAQRLRDLESENNRLKRLVAEQMLVIEGMKEVVRKKDDPVGATRHGPDPGPSRSLATQGMPLSEAESAHHQYAPRQAAAGGQARRSFSSGGRGSGAGSGGAG